MSNFFRALMTDFLTPASSSSIAASMNMVAMAGSLLARVTRVPEAFLLTWASSSSSDHPIRSHPVAPAFEAIVRRILEPRLRRSASSSRINSSR